MSILLFGIYILLLIITILINKRIYKTIFKINFYYTALWCFCGITSMYNDLEIIKPRLIIHIIIIVSILIFNMIYILRISKKKKTDYSFDDFNNRINIKLIYALNITAYLLISIHLIKAIRILMTSGLDLSYIRKSVYMSISSEGNSYVQLFTRTIPNAIFTFVSIISAIYLTFGKKNLLLLNVMNIIITTITFGGRTLLFNFIIFYIAACTILSIRIKIKVKKRYVISVIFILWLLTYLRTGKVFGFLDIIILYFSGSLSFLEYIFRNANQYDFLSNYKYGYMTLGFLFEPIVLILKLLFNIKTKIPSYYVNNYVQDFVNISKNKIVLYNNNTTMFYDFIKDFGVYGVYISIIILSYFITSVEKKFIKKGKTKDLIILIYLYSIIFMSSISYKLDGMGLLLIFILTCLTTTKFKYKKQNIE